MYLVPLAFAKIDLVGSNTEGLLRGVLNAYKSNWNNEMIKYASDRDNSYSIKQF